MARVVVAGAGAIGASIAYHLALRGADDVVLADVGEIAGGATGQGNGRCAPAVHDRGRGAARAGERPALPELGAPLFEQVGYLFLATTEPGLVGARGAARRPGVALGVPGRTRRRRLRRGPPRRRRARRDDLPRGRDRRPCGRDARARRGGRRRSASTCASERMRSTLDGRDARDRLRRRLAELSRPRAASSFPIRPLVRQLADVGPVDVRARRAADDDRGERLPLPAGRRTTCCGSRWGSRSCAGTARRRCATTSSRTGASGWRTATPRRRRAAPARVGRLLRHDAGRAPDHRRRSPTASTPPAASPATASCSRRRSAMRSRPSCSASTPPFDLAPYRLDRFAGGAIFPETLVL